MRRKKQNSKAIKILRLSAAQIRKRFQKQREVARLDRDRKQAYAAVKSFRVRKSDKGKLVMVGVKGQREPGAKGRKGYLIYVASTGRKQLVKQPKGGRFRAHKSTDITVPYQKRFKNKRKQFQASRLEGVGGGKKDVVKASGRLGTGGANDFSEHVVETIGKSVSRALRSQASHRIFVVDVIMLVETEHGNKTFSFSVPIERADHQAILNAGVINWVKRKFYAELANQLRFEGFITAGSSNHIKRVTREKIISKSLWEYYHAEQGRTGMNWGHQNFQIARIKSIEWQIKQAK